MSRIGGRRWHMIDEIDLVALVADHARLTRLCSDLEAFADRLPDMPAEDMLDRLRQELEHAMPTHEARETALLAEMFAHAPTARLDRVLLDHARRERTACVVMAQDLVAALKGDGRMPDPETLGYMLRCFFQGCRQAMAFEELAILHMAGGRLTISAAALLRGSIEARCGQ